MSMRSYVSEDASVGLAPSSPPKLWSDSCLRPYLGEINRRHGIIETLAMPSVHDLPPSRIETLFVSPLLAENAVNVENDPKTWSAGLSLFDTLDANPRLVVLGDPGGGKTTLSNWLAWRLSAGLTAPLPEVLTERIPLPCVLRDMSSGLFADAPTVSDLAVKIAQHLLADKADTALIASLQARVAAGRYVLILDGVDEIAVSHRKVIADWMKQAHEQDACVLATSRIVGYEDWVIDQPMVELPLKFEAGISWKEFIRSAQGQEQPAEEQLHWAERRYLLPFDQQRVAAFAENWYRQRCGTEQGARQKTNDLLTAIAQSPTTRQLARTPNLLSMMAMVHREHAHLPDGKALLYEEIANAYINTIDQQRKILPNDALAPYPWKARKGWLAYIAFQMQLRRSDEQQDDGLLVDEQDVLEWLSTAMRVSGVAQPEATAQEYLRWVARRSGLLLPRGEKRYAFVHLSFQEYFCACHLATRIVSPAFVKDKLKDDEAVTKAALVNWAKSTVWRETLVNLFELISAEQDVDWIVDLTEILFGEYAEITDFSRPQAELAVRLIQDKHIRLSEVWQERLAERCGSAAWWDRHRQDGKIWSALLDQGYAANVSSITEFSALTRLRLARVMNPTLSEIIPPSSSLCLRGLDLSKTSVSDVSALSGLTKLEGLDLSQTAVTDISALSGLTNLDWINLSQTAVSDISALSGLTHLWGLSLRQTSVSDVSALSGLTNLRELDLSQTAISDVSTLSELTNLRGLNLSETAVNDVSALAHLTQLKIVGFPEQPTKT